MVKLHIIEMIDMPVNRNHFKTTYTNFPMWPCPRCKKGVLVKKSDNFLVLETGPSKSERSYEEWDPDWITQRFAGLLHCNNERCKEISSISGQSGVGLDYFTDEEGNPEQEYEDYFTPLCIAPAPLLFSIIPECPKEISDALISAAELIWSDPDSSANKLRIGVELVLTDQKIPKFSAAKQGKKRQPLSLHNRIERFSKKNTEASECLMAIKWLGNHGSHGLSGLKRDNVLSAADFFEHAISIVYTKNSDHLKKAKSVNKKKGPI